jgi:hypothetical protein
MRDDPLPKVRSICMALPNVTERPASGDACAAFNPFSAGRPPGPLAGCTGH